MGWWKVPLIDGDEQKQKRGSFGFDKESLLSEIRYPKFAILHEETGLHLTFSFTSFKIEFNLLGTKLAHDSCKQVSNRLTIVRLNEMTMLSKARKSNNFEAHNSLKLIFKVSTFEFCWM